MTAQSTLMKRKDVVAVTGLCYTTIYNLERAGKFPPRKQLSPGRVAWVVSEVHDWIGNLSGATVPDCDLA